MMRDLLIGYERIVPEGGIPGRLHRSDGKRLNWGYVNLCSEIGWLKAALIVRIPVMRATARNIDHSSDFAARVDAIDWVQTTADLDAQGCAVLKGLLSPEECAALA